MENAGEVSEEGTLSETGKTGEGRQAEDQTGALLSLFLGSCAPVPLPRSQWPAAVVTLHPANLSQRSLFGLVPTHRPSLARITVLHHITSLFGVQ